MHEVDWMDWMDLVELIEMDRFGIELVVFLG
jgi:hypothetical protein